MAVGGYPQLVGLALEKEAGIDLNLVDIGGNADKIAALALLSEERNPLFDDIPTAKEQGLEKMIFGKFFFVAFPKDTPDDVVSTFSAAMKAATENEDFIKAAQDSYALTVNYMDPAAATEYANGVYEQLKSYQDLFLAAQ